jgi:biofilm PGA synthesis protein PgaD
MGNGKTKGLPLIIDKPALTPLPNRIGWGTATFIFWMLWAYLWLPLITSAVWALGYHQIVTHFPWSKQDHEMRRLIVLYVLIITGLGGSLVSWAQLEYRRFRHVHRRAMPSSVTVEELAVHAGLGIADMQDWQSARRLVVAHDDHGKMVYATES